MKIVDFSQLDLSNIRDFSSMFTNCKSLEYINLGNYDESGLSELNLIKFDSNIPSNLVICFDKDKAPQLYNSLNTLKCVVIYCGEDLKSQQLNYNEEKDSCDKNTYF